MITFKEIRMAVIGMTVGVMLLLILARTSNVSSQYRPGRVCNPLFV